MNKGTYILLLKLDRNAKIKVGKLGEFEFPSGYYVYVGSALNSLTERIKRHLSREKRYHWHIDYLLEYSKVILVLMIPSEEKIECKIARKLTGKVIVNKFGSTDCNCKTHLFYYKNIEKALKDICSATHHIIIKSEVA